VAAHNRAIEQNKEPTLLCVHLSRCEQRTLRFVSSCAVNVHARTCQPRDAAWHAERIRLATLASYALDEAAQTEERAARAADDFDEDVDHNASEAEAVTVTTAAAAAAPPTPPKKNEENELHVLMKQLAVDCSLNVAQKATLLSIVKLAFDAGRSGLELDLEKNGSDRDFAALDLSGWPSAQPVQVNPMVAAKEKRKGSTLVEAAMKRASGTKK
jgi:hypothetical protein